MVQITISVNKIDIATAFDDDIKRVIILNSLCIMEFSILALPSHNAFETSAQLSDRELARIVGHIHK